MANGRQLQGKELSYNNIVDLQAAWDLAQEFTEPVCAIIKHTNPCGTATGATLKRGLSSALWSAIRSRPSAASSASMASIDGEAAAEMAKLFVEAIAAPGFTPEAREAFAKRRTFASSRSPTEAEMGAQECLRRSSGAG